jgi:hypothetical protein
MRTIQTDRPVAVVGFAPSAAAPVLRSLLAGPVEELDPYDVAMGRTPPQTYRAVVVENYRPGTGGLSPCAAARWAMPAAPLTVVSLDEPEGRRLARQLTGRTFAYSDGRPQADLTAKNVNLRWGKLEFEALTDGGIARVCLDPGEDGLYGPLAALACALGLGMSLTEAVARLNTSV